MKFQNFHKQTNVPYVVYSDFEALVRTIHTCERGPKAKSYTEKREKHKAYGFAYKVVRSDDEVTGENVYRGENAVGIFLSHVLRDETKIRENLKHPNH